MGSIGDPITEGAIPAVGTSGTEYASDIDDFLTEVRARLEAKIPLTSLSAGTLDLANNPINNAEWISLYSEFGQTAPAGSIQNIAGNLWWITATGAVEITSGNAINTSTLGGITGDYATSSAQFRYVDADREYYAYSNFAGGVWARVWAQNFDIAAASTGAVRVRIDATGVGSSYQLNLPTAPPATTKGVVMTSAGQLAYRDTVSHVLNVPASAADPQGALRATGSGSSCKAWTINTSTVTFPVVLQNGDIISGYTVLLHKDSDNTHTISGRLITYDLRPSNAGGETLRGSGCTNAENATGDTTMTESLSMTVGESVSDFQSIYITVTGGASTDAVYGVVVTYTRAT